MSYMSEFGALWLNSVRIVLKCFVVQLLGASLDLVDSSFHWWPVCSQNLPLSFHASQAQMSVSQDRLHNLLPKRTQTRLDLHMS